MYRRMFVLFLLLFFIKICVCKTKLNSYVSVRTIESCPEDRGIWEQNYLIRKFNRTTSVLKGYVTSDRPLDDTLTLYLQMDRWGDGGWKKNFITIRKNKACSSIFFIAPELFKSILKLANLPEKCPVPKDTYGIETLPAKIPIPNLIRSVGTFQTVFKLIDTKANQTLLCFRGITVHGDA